MLPAELYSFLFSVDRTISSFLNKNFKELN
jgi:hypothetical protein